MYFLNINKPRGCTSFDIIRKLRKKLDTRQIGHSGTLDPLASGVLQIAVGKATKLLDYLHSDKKYVASLKFGYNTPTFDDESEKVFISNPSFSKEELIAALNSFIGISMQVPPKYSAVKQNGKKVCDIIRFSDSDVEINAREIEIYSIKLLDFNNYNEAKIEVHVKKGAYIRSLAYDLGKKLNCGCYLTDLIRTKAGNFDIKDAQDIDDTLTQINPIDVLPFESKELNDYEYNIIMHGNFIKQDKNYSGEKILLTKNKKLVSFANLSDNLIKPKRIFKGE